MKVGIISMQRVCNNGSFLQAYGLKKLIESLGHEVVFVDYHVGAPIMQSNSEIVAFWKLKIRNLFIDLFTESKPLRCLLPGSMRNVAAKRDEYKYEVLPLLGITDKKHYNTKVDVLVIGSDEVFNCTQINPEVGFSPELFGYGANAAKVISYAASFGNTTFQKLSDANKTEELKGFFEKFAAISVRDRNSYSIVKLLVGIEPEVNLDPVLMYDFMPTVPDKVRRRDYIVVYSYRSRITSQEAEIFRAFAKEEGKTLISVSGEMSWCDEHFKGTPFEMLDLFRHADYSITDTFHGTIFSIINRIKFVTLIRGSKGGVYGNQEKLQDLLNRLGLQDRSYSCEMGELGEIMNASIDYESVFSVIGEERKHTMNYLKDNIN